MALDQVDVDEIVEVKVEKEMSFFEHLEALRWHIIRALIAVASIATFVFFRKILYSRLLYLVREIRIFILTGYFALLVK